MNQEENALAEKIGAVLVGEDKYMTLIIVLSIAATTGHMLGMPKIELQRILMRLYDKRVMESRTQ